MYDPDTRTESLSRFAMILEWAQQDCEVRPDFAELAERLGISSGHTNLGKGWTNDERGLEETERSTRLRSGTSQTPTVKPASPVSEASQPARKRQRKLSSAAKGKAKGKGKAKAKAKTATPGPSPSPAPSSTAGSDKKTGRAEYGSVLKAVIGKYSLSEGEIPEDGYKRMLETYPKCVSLSISSLTERC